MWSLKRAAHWSLYPITRELSHESNICAMIVPNMNDWLHRLTSQPQPHLNVKWRKYGQKHLCAKKAPGCLLGHWNMETFPSIQGDNPMKGIFFSTLPEFFLTWDTAPNTPLIYHLVCAVNSIRPLWLIGERAIHHLQALCREGVPGHQISRPHTLIACAGMDLRPGCIPETRTPMRKSPSGTWDRQLFKQ